jgi:hypothetical protein
MIKLLNILNEIGEGTTPYEWSGPHEKSGKVEYYFETEDGDKYVIDFNPSGDDEYNVWGLTFYIDSMEDTYKNKYGVVTNKGRFFKVMSTVMSIMKNFMQNGKYPTDVIAFSGSDKLGTDTNQRNLAYQQYVEKNIKSLPDWDYKKYKSGRVRLIKKDIE